MTDQEKTVGAIQALEKTVLKSLEDHSGSIKELDAQLQEKVTELRKSIDEAKADGGKALREVGGVAEGHVQPPRGFRAPVRSGERPGRNSRAGDEHGKELRWSGGRLVASDPNVRERARGGRDPHRMGLRFERSRSMLQRSSSPSASVCPRLTRTSERRFFCQT